MSNSTTRGDERTEFLTDLLTTAIENGGHGWFYVNEYEPGALRKPDGNAYAVVADMETDEEHRVDLGVITRGLRVIGDAVEQTDLPHPDDGAVLHNKGTGERLFVSPAQQRNIVLADRTNGDEGDLDVIDALAIVECGLFGKVVYA